MAEQDGFPSFEGDLPAAADIEIMPDRRELALVAVERTRMPMVITDPRRPDNPIVLANHAFLELTGYSPDEVIGRNCRFLQGPETAKKDINLLREALTRDDDHIDVELLNYRKDGSSFWNQLSISAVRGATGELLYYFGSQKDVTARRRAQELEVTERLLLMEVDHRALNALSLVKSIVHLCRAEHIEQFSAAVQGRVDALARAHQLLASSGWTGAEFSALLTDGEATPQLRTEGAQIVIPAGLVQPLSLVLHELLINAKQHGALRDRQGEVLVRWHANDGTLIIHWREAGTSVTAPPAHKFGLNIVTGVVERQLGGQSSLDWQADGLRAQLTIPLQRG
jgi:PAS domain S-box-containing protein